MYRKSKPKDIEMGYLLNNGSDHIALKEFSLKTAEREINYKELFERKCMHPNSVH